MICLTCACIVVEKYTSAVRSIISSKRCVWMMTYPKVIDHFRVHFRQTPQMFSKYFDAFSGLRVLHARERISGIETACTAGTRTSLGGYCQPAFWCSALGILPIIIVLWPLVLILRVLAVLSIPVLRVLAVLSTCSTEYSRY